MLLNWLGFRVFDMGARAGRATSDERRAGVKRCTEQVRRLRCRSEKTTHVRGTAVPPQLSCGELSTACPLSASAGVASSAGASATTGCSELGAGDCGHCRLWRPGAAVASAAVVEVRTAPSRSRAALGVLSGSSDRTAHGYSVVHREPAWWPQVVVRWWCRVRVC